MRQIVTACIATGQLPGLVFIANHGPVGVPREITGLAALAARGDSAVMAAGYHALAD